MEEAIEINIDARRRRQDCTALAGCCVSVDDQRRSNSFVESHPDLICHKCTVGNQATPYTAAYRACALPTDQDDRGLCKTLSSSVGNCLSSVASLSGLHLFQLFGLTALILPSSIFLLSHKLNGYNHLVHFSSVQFI